MLNENTEINVNVMLVDLYKLDYEIIETMDNSKYQIKYAK